MTCEACRTIPPVVSTGYTAKGQYEDIAGIRSYVTGPPDAPIGLFGVYGVFDLAIQTLQGADRLATHLNTTVLVPDLFNGDAIQAAWYPPDTDEKKALVTKFMSEKAAFPQNVETLQVFMTASKAGVSIVERWGAYGLCWGLVALASGAYTPFVASGQTHPGRLEKADVEDLTIPHIALASKDEPADVVQEYSQIISSNGIGGEVEIYSSMWHGWMGARADLEDENGYAEYARGYDQFAAFVEKYLR
ncbi:alpha/beta-hydrolase [Aspergillus crustosus]